MKTEDFHFVWYPGVVTDVHKIYQTAPDIPKKVEQTSCDSLTFSKRDKPSNENGGFSCFFVTGCCSRFASFREAIAKDPKETTGALKATYWYQKATTWRRLGPTLGPLGVGRTLGGSLSLSLYIYIYIYTNSRSLRHFLASRH